VCRLAGKHLSKQASRQMLLPVMQMARYFLHAFLFGALKLALMDVIGHVVDNAFMWTMLLMLLLWPGLLWLPCLLLWPGLCGASMVWTLCTPVLASMIHPCSLLWHVYGPLNMVSRSL
jgi:hypothetical protein